MRVRTGPEEVKVRRQISSKYISPSQSQAQLRQSSQARRKSAKAFEGAGRVTPRLAGFTYTVTPA